MTTDLARVLRRPVVTGLARRAGTSTLAAALHAIDGGLLAPGTAGEADVLVSRADGQSLREAVALACPPSGPRPVLVLAGTAPGSPAPPVPAGRFGAVLVLPHVRGWAGGDAGPEAPAVLAFPPERLPPDVRAYAAVLHRVVAALVGSGQLRRGTPPLVSRPAATVLWRGLRPPVLPAPDSAVRRPPATLPTDHAEPDDEALEAEPELVAVGRA